jgi:hypothetical protein
MDKETLIQEFQAITGSTYSTATRFLNYSNWELDVGLNFFFENPEKFSTTEKISPYETNETTTMVEMNEPFFDKNELQIIENEKNKNSTSVNNELFEYIESENKNEEFDEILKHFQPKEKMLLHWKKFEISTNQFSPATLQVFQHQNQLHIFGISQKSEFFSVTSDLNPFLARIENLETMSFEMLPLPKNFDPFVHTNKLIFSLNGEIYGLNIVEDLEGIVRVFQYRNGNWFSLKLKFEDFNFEDIYGLVQHGNLVYMFITCERKDDHFKLLLLDMNDLTLKMVGTTGTIPSIRQDISFVFHDEYIYLFGGNCDGKFSNELFRFSINSLSWEKIETKGEITPRCGYSACIGGNSMYVFSGVVRIFVI